MTSHLFQVDALKVYSENCVVFLLSLWVRSHPSCTPEQLEELAHNVRVVNLSLSYLATILPDLEWFRGCSGMAAIPTLLLHKASGMKDLAGSFGPAAWHLKPRSGVLHQGARLSVAIGAEEVKKLAAGEQIRGDAVYRNGFYLRCSANTKSRRTVGAVPEEKKTLGMLLHTAMEIMEAALGIKWTERQGVAVSFSLRAPAFPRGLPSAATLVGSYSMGYPDCLNRSDPTIEEAVSPFLANCGVLKLSVEVTYVQ